MGGIVSRSALNKRLKDAETKTKAQQLIRDEAEARELSPERFEEIMQGMEASYRGGPTANRAYIKSLSTGELLRIYRDRDSWVGRMAQKISQEYMDQLAADGIGIDRMNDAELQYIIDHSPEDDDGIEWDDLPDSILDQIEADPKQVDFDELKKKYPKKYAAIAGPK